MATSITTSCQVGETTYDPRAAIAICTSTWAELELQVDFLIMQLDRVCGLESAGQWKRTAKLTGVQVSSMSPWRQCWSCLMVKLLHFWCFLCKTIWEPQHIPAWNPFLRLAAPTQVSSSHRATPGTVTVTGLPRAQGVELQRDAADMRIVVYQWFGLILTFSVPFL